MIEYLVLLLVISVLIILIRLARGPTAADRVLATDTINSLIIGIIVLLGIYYGNQMFVDIAIVYAMISFLATLSVSKYLMKKEMHEE
jgi:multicomponent Na+:H+ antiporter subunit F